MRSVAVMIFMLMGISNAVTANPYIKVSSIVS
jgi:hypothetical protein